jgi:hypothetical protein
MPDEQFRGYGLISCVKWINEELESIEKERVLNALPDELHAEMGALKPGMWYPRAWFEAISCAVADERGTTIEEKFAAVEELGLYLARDNQSSVLKLLMKFLTPATILNQLPKFWSKYYNSGVVTVVETGEANSGCVELKGFTGVRYISPTVSAWVRAAYEAMGITDLEIREVNNAPEDETPKEFRWEFRWKV